MAPIMSMSASQARALMERLPTVKPREGDAPRVLIPSPLVLTKDQESDFCSKALAHFTRLSIQLGRTNPAAQNWIPNLQRHVQQHGGEALPFLSQIALNHLMRQGRVEWRKHLIGGLFAEQNHHIPLIGRFVDQQVARACDNILGTEPFFTATPIGASDDKTAEQITQWTRHEAKEAELAATLREAYDLAFTQGYQPVKLHKDTRIDFYRATKMVAVDDKGEPIAALDGDYIYPTDQWQAEAPPVDPVATPSPAEHAALPPLGLVLQRDGQTPKPTPLKFELCSLTRVNTRFDGARASNIFYQDFLADLTEKDTQEAPVVIEVTTVPLISFIHTLLTNQAWQQNLPSPDERLKTISELMQNFSGTAGGITTATAAASQPRPENGENTAGVFAASKVDPDLNILVVWMHDDVNNDGLAESVVLLMTQDGAPLYYDYVANVTNDGLRPYEIIRVNPVAGRWWGIGEVQKFLPLQSLADLLFNRFLWAQSQAGNLVFWDPSKTIEGDKNPNMELNAGRTYRLVAGARAEDAAKIIPIHNIKGDELMKALETVFQAATNRSGVSSPNDARAAGLDTAQLATGVNMIEQSGQELFGKFLSDLTPPTRRIVKRFLGLVIFHIDGPRTFIFFEGDNATVITLSQEELRRITLHVDIDLSKYNGQQRLLQATAVANVMDRFMKYQNNPQAMALVQPVYLELAKASGMQHAEQKFPTADQVAGLAPPPAPPGPAPAPPPDQPDPNAQPPAVI